MDDYEFSETGILKQYAHLRGIHECMPVIRKLLGVPEHGVIQTNTFIGRAVQRFIENSGKDDVCESGND